MNVFIDNFISSSSFMQFEIGKKLNLDSYIEGTDYNPIELGKNGIGYYFFDSEIDLEVYEKNGLISSFDILLRNQENILFIGQENSLNFRLNNCKLDELIFYLNSTGVQWNFYKIVSDKSIAIVYYAKLQFTLYFDFYPDVTPALSLITLSE